MYCQVMNAIKSCMPTGATVLGYGKGHRTWLFSVSWRLPADSEGQNDNTHTIFIRIEHDVIESEQTVEFAFFEQRLVHFLQCRFCHFDPARPEYTYENGSHEIWIVTPLSLTDLPAPYPEVGEGTQK
jgi:hypothetical protein